ncbi:MAG: hypothetical protein JWM68_5455 [Verrucomicrobiales bacterium]|nr:hypothetical protein [Verrucomicrobiales bacterium]
MELSQQSRAILEAIAKGHTYEQILIQDLAWTYHDIFRAAAEALGTTYVPAQQKAYSVDDIRNEHPQAYRKWDMTQDAELAELFHSGKTVQQIADAMERQPGGIQSRLVKLNLAVPNSKGAA